MPMFSWRGPASAYRPRPPIRVVEVTIEFEDGSTKTCRTTYDPLTGTTGSLPLQVPAGQKVQLHFRNLP